MVWSYWHWQERKKTEQFPKSRLSPGHIHKYSAEIRTRLFGWIYCSPRLFPIILIYLFISNEILNQTKTKRKFHCVLRGNKMCSYGNLLQQWYSYVLQWQFKVFRCRISHLWFTILPNKYIFFYFGLRIIPLTKYLWYK